MSITFDGKSSEEYGLKMQNELRFETIERDMEVVKVPGRDGVVLLDNDRNETVSFPISFLMVRHPHFQTIEEQISACKIWLSANPAFSLFKWVGEPYHTYHARINGRSSFRRRNSRLAYVDVPFEFMPIKFLDDGLEEGTVLNNAIFVVKGSIPAKPIIKLTGTGNVNLTIKGKVLALKNVTGGVIVDCDLETVTNLSGTVSQMQNLYSYPFPNLVPGDNLISWDNAGFTVTMIPRWGDPA